MKAKKSAKKAKKAAVKAVDTASFNWNGLTCRIGKAAKVKPPKEIKVVTPEVLERIADMIYDPKSKLFLNLCSGTLQNGDDPANPGRPMHCGLGELYYTIRGRQPEQDGVSEDDVIEMVCERSGLKDEDDLREEATKAAEKQIRSLKLKDAELEDALLCSVENIMTYRAFDSGRGELYAELDRIPGDNDSNGGGGSDAEIFALRAERVADHLRSAAQIIRDNK